MRLNRHGKLTPYYYAPADIDIGYNDPLVRDSSSADLRDNQYNPDKDVYWLGKLGNPGFKFFLLRLTDGVHVGSK
ncbi:MAG: hypothetical protein ABFD08_14050 [Syntrophomonas sp.]